MGTVLLVLALALALAAAVIVYAAYPYRGEETPVSPRLGRAMQRGVRALPTLEPAGRARDPRDDRAGEKPTPAP